MEHRSVIIITRSHEGKLEPHAEGQRFHLVGPATFAFRLECTCGGCAGKTVSLQHAGTMQPEELESYIRDARKRHEAEHAADLMVLAHLEGLNGD